MYYLGIDPGAKGAFAIIHSDGTICALEPFNKGEFVWHMDWLTHQQEKTICCLERVHAMPKQGSVSMFTFGENYGWLKGVLDMAEISYQEIAPQTWKKEFNLNSDKTKSIEVAKQLFPKANLMPAGCRKPQDGLAEALLLSLYAQRKL